MSRSNKTDKPRTFESAGSVRYRAGEKPRQDTFARLYESMLLSDAYIDLTDKQKHLYTLCKAQYIGKRKPERDYPDIEELEGAELFYLNWDLVWNVYKLYSEKSHSAFYHDMDALISHGFITRISSGRLRRAKTVYRYSNKWQSWKLPSTMKRTKPKPT